MSRPLRILCLDIEGGFGGSSRSLYEALHFMDRSDLVIEVWCAKDGPIRHKYGKIGIPCEVKGGMPRMNSLPRISRNLYGYALFAKAFTGWRGKHDLLEAIRSGFDLVHFNHEALHLVARWLRVRHAKAQTMHVRTMIPQTVFGRFQCRGISRSTDGQVFITENERENFECLSGRPSNGKVIYNIADGSRMSVSGDPAVAKDARLKVAVVSSFSWARGIDRIVDVAEALAARQRRDLVFVVAGNMRLSGKMPGQLGQMSREGATLADYAEARGVSDMFRFLGHVEQPEAVHAACDVLMKPTRENNPWGRDILEALASGKPVISIGSYDRFVEAGKTGFLLECYDREAVADILIRLDEDPGLAKRLGQAGQSRVSKLCSGPERAADLRSFWSNAVAAREHQ